MVDMDYNYHLNYVGFADPDKDKSVLKYPTGRSRMNLFHEFNISAHEEYPPMYTMREEPHRGLPSAYLIYMTSESEYEAAMKLFGSWSLWKKYENQKQFLTGPLTAGIGWTGLAAWREEKEIRDAAKAYTQLKASAETGNVTAQKEIWQKAIGKGKAGRPSKAEKQKAAAEAAERQESLKNDLERIQLVAKDGKQV